MEDGIVTGKVTGTVVDGNRKAQLLREIAEKEGIKLEPSALAGMMGAIVVSKDQQYQDRMKFDDAKMKNATHLVWATGGGMVPELEMNSYLEKSGIK